MSALDFKLYLYQNNELFKKVAINKGHHNSWLLGSAEDAHITLNNARISKHHLQIIYNKEGELHVQDLGSTNGTFLNGIKLEKSQLLKHKDKLQLAGVNDVLIIIEKPTFMLPNQVKESYAIAKKLNLKISSHYQRFFKIHPNFLF